MAAKAQRINETRFQTQSYTLSKRERFNRTKPLQELTLQSELRSHYHQVSLCYLPMYQLNAKFFFLNDFL